MLEMISETQTGIQNISIKIQTTGPEMTETSE